MNLIKKQLGLGIFLIGLLFSSEILPIIKNLKLQRMISQCRLVMIPTIIGITAYFNRSKLVDIIEHNPILFVAMVYFLGNSMIDAVTKYRQINQMLKFFLFSQKMSRYVLCMFAVKNTMKKLRYIQGTVFNEQEFSDHVLKKIGYTLEELSNFSFELLKNSIHSIDNLHIDINTTDIEEKVYFVIKDQMSLEQILVVCKDDAVLYPKLMCFHDDPEGCCIKIMDELCELVHQHFNYFAEKY